MGKQETTTLQAGQPAPLFRLKAADGTGEVALEDLLRKGPVILEFLRGTW
jgi:peroxiredoxin